jgi:hypothetical protein
MVSSRVFAEILLLLGWVRFFGIGRAKSIEITLESRDRPRQETHFRAVRV